MYLLENKLSDHLLIFLKKNNLIGQDEKLVSIEKPGEGNMNLVLRIITDQRSFILKQSRDFVHKYPQIEAPIERILVEAEFYKAISKNALLKSSMPKLLGFFPQDFLLALEDLGQNSDYTAIYQANSPLSNKEVVELTQFLNNLHSLDIQEYPANKELKQLNHYHIFTFPFEINNGYDLDVIQPGLQVIANRYKIDEHLKSIIKKLGELYLETDKTLIHGDYYPGSWLKTEGGIKIIDPEFGYLGMAEFDLAVMVAHFKMGRRDGVIQTIFDHYSGKFDLKLVNAFAGIEIMRRLLGVAQLPLSLTIFEKTEILDWAFAQINTHEN